MKKVLYFTVGCALALTSCTKFDLDDNYSAITKENAENLLGIIDPKQDWNSCVSGSVTVTADAPLYNVAKVQILTESPVMNTAATVLAEAETQKGGIVTLNFEAPNYYDRLVVACVDNAGHYYIKGFDIDAAEVSFSSSSAARTRAVTRSGNDYPDASVFSLNPTKSEQSYNAIRTTIADEAIATNNASLLQWTKDNHVDLWAGAKWENERLWHVSDNSNTGTAWTATEGTIVRDADPMSDEEWETLTTLLKDFILTSGNGPFKRRDNLALIRESGAFKFYDNHLASDGQNPITIIPVQMGSTEIGSSSVYYYYYDPSNIPSGMSETDYIKALPKFEAIHCSKTKNASKSAGYQDQDFFKIHEYLLPYYGEPSDLMPQTTAMSSFSTTDGKLYRIRNGKLYNEAYYYMTYTGQQGNDADKLATKVDDDDAAIAMQLWQIFTTADNKKMLYNVGAKRFLTFTGDWATMYTDNAKEVKNNAYKFEETDADDGGKKYQIWRHNNTKKGLGSDLGVKANKGVYSDKNTSNNDNFDWYLEEYTGHSASASEDADLITWPTAISAASLVIPKDYHIGFMIRKTKHSSSDLMSVAKHNMNGCCYGYGELNVEINQFPGHFISSTVNSNAGGTMENTDPRAAYFCANGKTYIAFEDGSDTNFNDLIIEVGGYDKTVLEKAPEGTEEKGNGIETNYLYDETEIEGLPYTLCFEDRPIEADYDLNDVVLRCMRKGTVGSKYGNYVELTILAAGGNDDVYIRNITANGVERNSNYTNIEGVEIHDLFMVDYESEGNRFVNTVKGAPKHATITGMYKLPEGMTIPQFLSQIYIENKSTGYTIPVAKTGDSPCGIIIPGDFDYPMEKEMITHVYTLFKSWANKASDFKNWFYTGVEEDRVINVDEVIHN